MSAVYEKELRSYFSGMMGYIVLAFILLVGGFFCYFNNFSYGSPYFEHALYSSSFVLLFVVPILTMRSLAEEKHQKTDQLLYALPLSMSKIVLGKYFAMLTVYGMGCAVMALYPLFMSFYGSVSFLTSYAALLCYFLLGAALIAVGLFMSSLTESQVIAAVLSFGSMLAFYLMNSISAALPTSSTAGYLGLTAVILLIGLLVYLATKNYWIAFSVGTVLEIVLLIVFLASPDSLSGILSTSVGHLALFDRLMAFVDGGVFDITALVYYISIAACFLFFTIQTMEKKRWA